MNRLGEEIAGIGAEFVAAARRRHVLRPDRIEAVMAAAVEKDHRLLGGGPVVVSEGGSSQRGAGAKGSGDVAVVRSVEQQENICLSRRKHHTLILPGQA